jgi:hypothetical protein
MESYRLNCNCKISAVEYQKYKEGDEIHCKEHDQKTLYADAKGVRFRGRRPGYVATRLKYRILCRNLNTNRWNELGSFISLREASNKLKLDYNMLTGLTSGRRKNDKKYYKVEEIPET